jgi:hypothetical protein
VFHRHIPHDILVESIPKKFKSSVLLGGDTFDGLDNIDAQPLAAQFPQHQGVGSGIGDEQIGRFNVGHAGGGRGYSPGPGRV